MADPVALAVFAKAPMPGYAKTRLVPLLGREESARLQARLTRRALATAVASGTGPATLWCAPDAEHPVLRALAAEAGVALAAQSGEDLGARMLAAFRAAAGAPLVLIGTDCPSLAPEDLRAAADALRAGADLVLSPAEDGGYGLIGLRGPAPALFEAMPWGSERVAALTLERARKGGLRIVLLRTIWDVDTPEDYARLVRENLLGE